MRLRSRASNWLWLLLAVLGCAASPAPEPRADPARTAARPTPEPPVLAPPGTLYREDLLAQLEAGLGDFLGKVDVEARLEGEQFVGWRILRLRPAEAWSQIDLRPGDVVTRVNDMPIERETEAYDAFQATRTAQSLEVSYLRGGQQRRLTLAIVPRPEAESVPASASATP